MPELPEVETVCRGLARALDGARIVKLDQRRPDLRLPMPKNLPARLKGRQVLSITRRAKYILIALDGDETLLLHLGMSGRMVVENSAQSGRAQEQSRLREAQSSRAQEQSRLREAQSSRAISKPEKHDHLIFHFDNGAVVRFNDPRRFGVCDLIKNAAMPQHKLLAHLGIEPLEAEMNAAALAEKFAGKKVAVKDALMDQKLVVGVGNIYASESLFDAGIDPTRAAGSCTKQELTRLVASVQKVLKAAIKAGGSSLRDYRQADGELGYFQHQFAVYDHEGQACPGCTCNIGKTGGIKRITQGGRSTYYCPVKQA